MFNFGNEAQTGRTIILTGEECQSLISSRESAKRVD